MPVLGHTLIMGFSGPLSCFQWPSASREPWASAQGPATASSLLPILPALPEAEGKQLLFVTRVLCLTGPQMEGENRGNHRPLKETHLPPPSWGQESPGRETTRTSATRSTVSASDTSRFSFYSSFLFPNPMHHEMKPQIFTLFFCSSHYNLNSSY